MNDTNRTHTDVQDGCVGLERQSLVATYKTLAPGHG